MSVSTLPAARPVVWPLRPRASARVSSSRQAGRTVVTVEHAPLAGVTAEMLTWWYRHVPGTMPYAGGVHARYLVWHPLDHISYRVVDSGDDDRSVRAGTALHIVEALGRDLDSLLDIHVVVERIDEHSAVIRKRVLGSSIVRLENEFESGAAGAKYVTRMILGDDTVAGRVLLNRIAHTRALPPRKTRPVDYAPHRGNRQSGELSARSIRDSRRIRAVAVGRPSW
jgi:hypothetical protein